MRAWFAGPASQFIAQKGRVGGSRQAEGRSLSTGSSDADSGSGGSDDEGTSGYKKGESARQGVWRWAEGKGVQLREGGAPAGLKGFGRLQEHIGYVEGGFARQGTGAETDGDEEGPVCSLGF